MNIAIKYADARLYSYAFMLALFTIFYNLLEGFISTYFGFEDETLALFGFGVDSFIETISGMGVAHMIFRMRRNPTAGRDDFEKTALRVTGYSFYALTLGLVITACVNVYIGHQPQTTFAGVVISIISIVVMSLLIYGKIKVGRQLNSAPILADANCTKVCIYMSVILLISSGVYELIQLPYIDTAGTLGLAWFAYKEGKECFEKASSNKVCSCSH